MKATPKQPGVYITKKKEVMLFIEKELHGEAFDCPACELFGFGTGALICEATAALQGDLGLTLVSVRCYRNECQAASILSLSERLHDTSRSSWHESLLPEPRHGFGRCYQREQDEGSHNDLHVGLRG